MSSQARQAEERNLKAKANIKSEQRERLLRG